MPTVMGISPRTCFRSFDFGRALAVAGACSFFDLASRETVSIALALELRFQRRLSACARPLARTRRNVAAPLKSSRR